MLMISKCILQYLQNQQMESCTKISKEVVAVWDEEKKKMASHQQNVDTNWPIGERQPESLHFQDGRPPVYERHTSQCVE